MTIRQILRNRDGLALPLIALSMFFAVFAIGSVHRWAIVAGAALSLIATLPYLTSRRSFVHRSSLMIFLGTCALLTLIQVIPWPAAIIAVLSPAKHALVVDNAAALGTPAAGFFPLSLDPTATLRELAKLVSYLGFAYGCLRLAVKKSHLLGQLIVLTGSAVALTGLGHRLTGATSLFGLYQPEFAQPEFLSPLLNTNHLAGLMALCASIALGLLIRADNKMRVPWLVALLLCSGVAVLSESRGGVVALAVGLVMTSILCLIQRRSGPRPEHTEATTRIPQVIVGLCILTLLAIATGGGVLQELSNTQSAELTGEIGKLELWRASLPIIAKHPLAGVGRGAFEPAISGIRASKLSHSSLENEYLQAIVDWGLIGAAIASAALVFLAIAALRRWRFSALEAGALSGVVGLALQNMVDFSLSLPGVALPTIAALAILTRMKLAETKKPHRLHMAGLVVGALVLVIASTSAGRAARQELCHEPCELTQAIEIWNRHPSDSKAGGQVAIALQASKAPESIAVLNRALSANPFQWGLHLLAARWLMDSQAKSQALVEYASALKYAPVPRLAMILAELTKRFPSDREAAKGLPIDTARILRLQTHLTKLKRPKVALLHANKLYELGFQSLELFAVLSHQAKLAGDHTLALQAAQRGYELSPDPKRALQLAAAQFAKDDPTSALATLDQALKRNSQGSTAALRIDLLIAKAKILILQSKPAEGRAVLQEAAKVPAAKSARAKVYDALARLEQTLGNTNQAKLQRSKALELRSSNSARR